MQTLLTDDQWLQYTRDGYLKLGRLLPDARLRELQNRIDDIMLGKADVDYDRMLMQLDSDTGEYADMKDMTAGHKGARLDYRKIEQLEFDPVFLRYVQLPIFNEICARTYGGHVPVSVFRSMFMNKPANKGTKLPWHQDRWTQLDRDPLVTLWTALDPATVENGCVEVIPGSHKFGVLNPEHGSGFLNDALAAEHCRTENRVHLELEPGEAVLLHNWLLHASDKNHSSQSRRAFSVCYMDARTVDRTGRKYPVVFGEGALNPEALKLAAA